MFKNCAVALVLVAAASLLAQSPNKKPQPAPQKGNSAPAGAFVLRGGRLLTITHGVIENGVLVMQNGKITAVGAAGATAVPAGAKVLDVTGMTVYPGLIDSETHLGLTEIPADRSTVDTLENSDEIMPHMHVYDAFHAETALIPVTRVNGITNAIVAPAIGDTLPGQDSFIQLAGRSANDMLMVRDIALPLNFTGPQRRNESFDRAKFPQTRWAWRPSLGRPFWMLRITSRKWRIMRRRNPVAATSRETLPRKI